MQWMGLNEIREEFLKFFESKEHYRLPSASLVPKGDGSLLLINSGMAPLKPFFKGTQVPPAKRVTTCQKCIRTPDIDRVGKTARHGTFFEMLGNFSFGDYFKHEAIAWAWEFSTEVMGLPPERIYPSVYEEDDEAFDIWVQEIGIDPKRITRLGKEDNFWEHGAGPCGPCSELYFDRGEEYGCGSPDCGPGCECDRFMEYWNLVFTQFDSDGKGNYPRLANPNIDTGMGLERLACILQGVDNLFQVDTIKNIMLHASKITGVRYGDDPKNDVSLRVITDHIRSTVFMVGDGVLPSNEGRGYVLRRLLRRAARHGRILGMENPFLYELCDTVIAESGEAYPELREKEAYIKKVIEVEENRFEQTINLGLSILNGMIDQRTMEGAHELRGEDFFKLYDTFGFPVELVKEILEERGFSAMEGDFVELMKKQRETARQAHLKLGDKGWSSQEIVGLDITEVTRFAGYESLRTESTLRAIIADGAVTDGAQTEDAVAFVLDVTPFYGESGGQVGDRGMITSPTGKLKVKSCAKLPTGQYLHSGVVTEGSFMVGDKVTAAVDEETRFAVMRNHSCVHLIQAALRRVLGTHVEQAGSYVDAEKLRFDFTHFSAMTKDEIDETERRVNQAILRGMNVVIAEKPIEEAKQMGAMALFGEKYGKVVRVVQMGDYSTELCGGTHVGNTGNIGLCKFLGESSVAAGVRRIEAVTGENVIKMIHMTNNLTQQLAGVFKTSGTALVERAEQLQNENRELHRKLEELDSKMAAAQVSELLKQAEERGGLKLLSKNLGHLSTEELRQIGDKLKDQYENIVAVLAAQNGDKLNFLAVCGKEAVKQGYKAGELVKAVAQITGGSGGGRPDSAMAGGKDASKLQEALDYLGKRITAQS